MSSRDERKGKRGHEDGNVRPADGRYGLHDPKDESKYVSNSKTPDGAVSPRRSRRGNNSGKAKADD